MEEDKNINNPEEEKKEESKKAKKQKKNAEVEKLKEELEKPLISPSPIILRSEIAHTLPIICLKSSGISSLVS